MARGADLSTARQELGDLGQGFTHVLDLRLCRQGKGRVCYREVTGSTEQLQLSKRLSMGMGKVDPILQIQIKV